MAPNPPDSCGGIFGGEEWLGRLCTAGIALIGTLLRPDSCGGTFGGDEGLGDSKFNRIRKIPPVWIAQLDQPYLLTPIPPLDLSLTLTRRVESFNRFAVDEVARLVPGAEFAADSLFVLIDSLGDISRHSGVQSPCMAGNDVDEELCWHLVSVAN